MIKAFIHVRVASGKLDDIAKSLKNFKEIKAVYAITGDYDLLAWAEAADFAEVMRLVKTHILTMEFVERTSTAVVYAEY
jgi:DNA-binding Lrp family transcriptional regulator